MIKKAVILCGGMATRFMPYCKSVPKEMLPILNKPILHYLVEDLVEEGITDILIVIGRNKESIFNYFDKVPELEERLIKSNKKDLLNIVNKPQNLANITFIKQIEPKGTGYATLKAKNWVGSDNFYLCFGDELMFNNKESCVKQLLEKFNQCNKSIIAVQSCKFSEVEKYGIIKAGKIKNNLIEVLDIIEKPKPENAPSNICYIGPAVLKPEIFDIIEKTDFSGLELNLTDSFKLLAKENKIFAMQINGERFDCGNVTGFLKANIFYGLKDKGISEDIINYLNNKNY